MQKHLIDHNLQLPPGHRIIPSTYILQAPNISTHCSSQPTTPAPILPSSWALTIPHVGLLPVEQAQNHTSITCTTTTIIYGSSARACPTATSSTSSAWLVSQTPASTDQQRFTSTRNSYLTHKQYTKAQAKHQHNNTCTNRS